MYKGNNTNMHIGIDARMYGTQNGGIGRYIEQLIKYLSRLDNENQYTVFVKPESAHLLLPENWNVVRAPIHWYTWKEQTQMLKILNNHPTDLMHFPHWNVPLMYNKPFVVTIHDLILFHFPSKKASTLSPLKYLIKQYAYKKVINHAAKKSKHILTVSNFSKQDIVNTLQIDPNKITVTPLGITQNNAIPNKTMKSNETPNTTSRPYVLYVGVQYPHKNLEFLINLFQDSKLSQYDLIIAGPRGPFSKKLKDFIETKGHIKIIHDLSDSELNALYTHASAFVFPSHYEGFGLPPLEAMAHGVPVVASNKTAMIETLKGAALLCDPLDSNQWIESLEIILKDKTARARFVAQGKARSQQYSWERCTSSTLNRFIKYSK